MLTVSPLQLQKYTNLDQKGNIIAEYIWIDAFGATRSKARVSQSPTTPKTPSHTHPATSGSRHICGQLRPAIGRGGRQVALPRRPRMESSSQWSASRELLV